MTKPAGDRWMVIFNEAPHSAECGQILHLCIRKVCEIDTRSLIKLMIGVQWRYNARSRLCDRHAVDKQLQVVNPSFACSREEKPEKHLFPRGYVADRYRVRLPVSRAVQVLSLQRGECKTWRVPIHAHP